MARRRFALTAAALVCSACILSPSPDLPGAMNDSGLDIGAGGTTGAGGALGTDGPGSGGVGFGGDPSCHPSAQAGASSACGGLGGIGGAAP